MSELKLTNEKMHTFDGHEKIGTFKASAKLMEFGSKQNEANEILGANINDLIKRVCALEDKQIQTTENMRMIAEELGAFKKELDRVRLSEKLNSSTVERLSNALRIAEENSKPEE